MVLSNGNFAIFCNTALIKGHKRRTANYYNNTKFVLHCINNVRQDNIPHPQWVSRREADE